MSVEERLDDCVEYVNSVLDRVLDIEERIGRIENRVSGLECRTTDIEKHSTVAIQSGFSSSVNHYHMPLADAKAAGVLEKL